MRASQPGTQIAGDILAGLPPYDVIFGRSAAMWPVRDRIERAAKANSPVLIRGESGTGKEIVAKLIHARSPRRGSHFVKVYCPTIPLSLIENELFGYEAGAFAEANSPKPGRVDAGHGGTLFMDEIADLDERLQVRLLHVLQDGQVLRIAAQGEMTADAFAIGGRTMASQMLRSFVFVLALILAALADCSSARAQDTRKQPAINHDQNSTTLGFSADGSASKDRAASATSDPSYVIGPEDVLSVHVWHEAEISGKMPVRSDGKITLPLLGDIQASGLTPARLQLVIAQRLRDFINDPQVTVVIEEMNSRQFTVMGEVQHPGSFPLTHTTRVMDALAIAGGFRDFAKVKKIHIIRHTAQGGTQIISFNYREVVNGHKLAQNIELEAGDTVVVP